MGRRPGAAGRLSLAPKRIGSEQCVLGSQTHVNGRTWLPGRTVRIDGVLDRDVHVAGADVQIAGEIRQPLEEGPEKIRQNAA